MRKLSFLTASVALMLASCQETTWTPEVANNEVSFSSNITSAVTRVAGDEFEIDDAISVFANNGSELYANNVKYTYQGDKFTSASPITYTDNVSSLSFDAIYPYSEDASKEFTFAIPTDQSVAENFAAADLLTASTQSSSSTTPELIFNHKLVQLDINLTLPTSSTEITDLLLCALTSVECDLNEDTYVGAGALNVVAPLKNSSASYSAIIAPQQYAAGDLLISMVVDGVASSFNLTSTVELVSGYKYTCTISVESGAVTFEGDIEDWNDGGNIVIEEVRLPFNGASGTIDDPYQVGVPSDFVLMSETTLGGNNYQGEYFVMTNDIDMESVQIGTIGAIWISSGSIYIDNMFDAVFDGAGYTVKNYYVNDSKAEELGLFGCLGPNAVIKNLTVEGEMVFDDRCALVAARNFGTITNCTAKGSCTGGYNVGTIVGQNGYNGLSGYGVVENCVNYATVACTGLYGVAGGIGAVNYGEINNCVNYADFTSRNYTGGIIASNFGVINECINYGDITCTGYKMGGIAAEMLAPNNEVSVISNCINYGTLKGMHTVGGIVGINNRYVVNCINKGKVEATSYLAGGIAADHSVSPYGTGACQMLYSCNVGEVVSADATQVGAVICSGDGTTPQWCYFLEGCAGEGIYGQAGDSAETAEAMISQSVAELQSEDFVTLMNEKAAAFNASQSGTVPYSDMWATVSGDYPTLVFGTLAK